MKINQRGLSLIEIIIGLGLLTFLGLIVTNLSKHVDRRNKIEAEDIQNLISKLGASKVITRDLMGASPSFNYLNLPDDLDKIARPFYVLAKNEYCQESSVSTCKRQYTLSIPKGAKISKYFYIISTRALPDESSKLSISAEGVFSLTTRRYSAINRDSTIPAQSISKSSSRAESPWTKSRLMMLTSNNDFYDCFNKTHTMGETDDCPINCSSPGACNYVAKREFKMLGIVNDSETELNFSKNRNLMKYKYKMCSLKKDLTCLTSRYDILSSKIFFERLPFMPGHDNGAYLAPVELVRYHIERSTPTSPEYKNVLMRSVATKSGSFESPRILMSGIQSLLFTRNNVSEPTIEYKIIKAKAQQTIK